MSTVTTWSEHGAAEPWRATEPPRPNTPEWQIWEPFASGIVQVELWGHKWFRWTSWRLINE